MNRFEELRYQLEEQLSSPDPSQLGKLKQKLERARPAFLALLDSPPKSQKERQRIEAGKASTSSSQSEEERWETPRSRRRKVADVDL